MSAPSTSGLSVGLLLRVIDVKYGCLLYFNKCRPRLRAANGVGNLISAALAGIRAAAPVRRLFEYFHKMIKSTL